MNERLSEALVRDLPLQLDLWRASTEKYASEHDRRFSLLMINKDRYDSPWCNAWRALGELQEMAASEQIRTSIRESLLNDIPDSAIFAKLLRAELPLQRISEDYLRNTCARFLFSAIEKWFAQKQMERLVPHQSEPDKRIAIQSMHWMLCKPGLGGGEMLMAAMRTWEPRTFLEYSKEYGESKFTAIFKQFRHVYPIDLDQAVALMREVFPDMLQKK